MMRVIIDANVWISFLLGPRKGSVIDRVVVSAFVGAFQLVTPQELVDELRVATTRSIYLKNHIAPRAFETLMEQLSASVVTRTAAQPRARISRDPNDDYLIEYALALGIDFLVTGDQDLLALPAMKSLRIVTPKAFLDSMSENPSQ